MRLVDTSVWIDHLRRGNADLVRLLSRRLILIHPAVIGELACGSMKNRSAILSDLQNLPCATLATDAEALHLIETKRLWGRGLGWIDAHLLASALLSNCGFSTLDKRLAVAAGQLGLA